MAERIIVPFEGEGSGSEALSWGQAEIWHAMRRQRSWLPLITVTALPPGTTPGDLTASLRLRMSRYPSMRTRFQPGEDGRPRQVLAASGETTLEIAGGGHDPAGAAEAVRDRYLAARPDLATEWPLQMTAIRHRGVLTHLVTAVCHLAVDAFGTAAMLTELAGPGRCTTPPDGLTPLDQARWQRSPAGQRVSSAAMRHWARLLATVPPDRFRPHTGPCQPRYAEAGFRSPALHLAAQVAAARAGTGTAPARVTGGNPVLARVVVSNRFRPGLANSVSQVAQTGLCVIDAAGVPFGEAVRRAWRMSLAAFRHAYYDPGQLEELVARLSRERGRPIDVGCFYNDRRMTGLDPGGAVPAAADIEAALPHTTLRWQPLTGRPSERFFLHVNDVPGTVDLTVCADTAHVSPAELELLLRTMEEVTVAAALDRAAASSQIHP
jgi:condensation domain-containing protein